MADLDTRRWREWCRCPDDSEPKRYALLVEIVPWPGRLCGISLTGISAPQIGRVGCPGPYKRRPFRRDQAFPQCCSERRFHRSCEGLLLLMIMALNTFRAKLAKDARREEARRLSRQPVPEGPALDIGISGWCLW